MASKLHAFVIGDLRAHGLVTFIFELAVAAIFNGISLKKWKPYDSPFVERDPALSRPLIESEVPSWMLVLLSCIVPGILFLCMAGVGAARKKCAARPAAAAALWALLALYLSVATAQIITNSVKNYVGRKRPNFFGKCDYAGFDEDFDACPARVQPAFS